VKDERRWLFGRESRSIVSREYIRLMLVTDNFATTVSHYLVHLIKTAKQGLKWPISSLKLLCFFIQVSTRMNDDSLMKLSLTDLSRFEQTLQDLAKQSTDLSLVLSKEHDSIYLLDANILSKTGCFEKKRKRSDEDDSGEEDVPEGISSEPSTSNVNESLIRSIRVLLDKPSAKSKLLARRVSSFSMMPKLYHLSMAVPIC